ncbi:MAG: hypothetical protein IJU71_05455 [Selenomonadaceae bacterium]|nr:hypothetical protein [Selenomonadaceae bacterium]
MISGTTVGVTVEGRAPAYQGGGSPLTVFIGSTGGATAERTGACLPLGAARPAHGRSLNGWG